MVNNADDKAVIAALLTRWQRLWLQSKADRDEKDRLENALKEHTEQFGKLRAALSVFGFDTTVDGVWQRVRDEIGVDAYNAAVAKGSLPSGSSAQAQKQEKSQASSQSPPGDGSHRTPVRELVLERLKAGGSDGLKASAIRESIEAERSAKLHSKTVGMTLYRLSLDGLVRRQGQHWFFVPPKAETKNPGVGAPGPNQSENDRKGGA